MPDAIECIARLAPSLPVFDPTVEWFALERPLFHSVVPSLYTVGVWSGPALHHRQGRTTSGAGAATRRVAALGSILVEAT